MSSARHTLITAFILAIVHNTTLAQLNTSRYEVGFNLGTIVYQGDLSGSYHGDFKSLQPAVGIYVSKTVDPYFAWRVDLWRGNINANETAYSTPQWKQQRGFKFSSSITELSSTLVFNPMGNSNEVRRFTPYLFAGAGVTFLNIKRDWSNLDRNVFDSKSDVATGLVTDSAHTPPKVIGVLPVGAGLRFALNTQLSLHTEATYRFTGTDYLDGFKYSANPKRNDRYYGLSVGLSYRLGGYRCPRVGN